MQENEREKKKKTAFCNRLLIAVTGLKEILHKLILQNAKEQGIVQCFSILLTLGLQS